MQFAMKMTKFQLTQGTALIVAMQMLSLLFSYSSVKKVGWYNTCI